jgi:UDP-N-acetylglucosamine--N-acetylmuramyl-(pentapeptide) pyrophosphoryl-undecaprenol N-acetylglucosamine transferase
MGKGIRARLAWPWILLAGVAKSFRLLAAHSPDALVAAGGYVGAAPLLAARLSGRTFFLLEQNRIPGRVTRFFSGRARECFFAFPPVGEQRPNWTVTGNPLRAEIARDERHDDGRTVLVLGGSGGARALNLAALDAAAALGNLNFIVLTGRRDYELVRSRVRSKNIELVEFTKRPEELYKRATIAISRAGGMVLSEIVAYGIPAILVPFPHATDRHQDANAQYMASLGAAIFLDQDRLSGLMSLIRTLMDDQGRRRQMEKACRAAARPDAARVVAERIIQCLAA